MKTLAEECIWSPSLFNGAVLTTDFTKGWMWCSGCNWRESNGGLCPCNVNVFQENLSEITKSFRIAGPMKIFELFNTPSLFCLLNFSTNLITSSKKKSGENINSRNKNSYKCFWKLLRHFVYKHLTMCNRILLRSWFSFNWPRNSPPFMEMGCSLLCSKDPATGSYLSRWINPTSSNPISLWFSFVFSFRPALSPSSLLSNGYQGLFT